MTFCSLVTTTGHLTLSTRPVLAGLGQLYELLLAVPSVGRHDGRAVEGGLLPRQVQVAVTLHMALPAGGGAAGAPGGTAAL